MHMPYPKVASDTMPDIIDLCKKLAPNSQPIYLNIEIINGAIENECYNNVESQIKNQGGSIQYGWQIWETIPDIMAEAEFHAVWLDNSGKLHDLTPKSLPWIDRILFLPDSVRKYNGGQIDNVRIPLQDDDLIKKFIENAEKYFEVTNRGELENYHGEIIATAEMKRLIEEKNKILLEIIQNFFNK